MYEVKSEVIRNIVDEFEMELEDRYYSYSHDAIGKIIDEWLKRKQNLLGLLSKHPLWNPDKLMIQFDQDYDRRIELDELRDFCKWLHSKLTTYLYRSPNTLDSLGITAEEELRRIKIINWMSNEIEEQFFNETMKDKIDLMNSYNDNFKLRTNMKASKAIGKICREEGWDKLDGYNTRYAALSDNINPIKVKRHTVISLNPLDFLLMSNGDSWESCHYIGDCADESGCYSSGTISYMLDECSFVFYTVSADYNGDNIELAKKSQREIFGYNDEVFIQSRLYPQANDYGAEAIYDDIRHIVQKIISDCLNVPNLWTVSRDLHKVNNVVEHGEGATCYPDWHSGCPGSNHVSLSTLKMRPREGKKIVLGAKPICISCGYRHTRHENISCCEYGEVCTKCGSYVNNDDVYWVNDEPYCENCVIYCESCNGYEVYDKAIEIDGYWYCKDCADDIAAICDACGEWHLKEDMYLVEDDRWYCNDCIEDNADYCEECNTYHDKENMIYMDDGYCYCKDCIDNVAVKCEKCGEYVYTDDAIEIDGKHYCGDCFDEFELEEDEEEMESVANE